MADARYRDRYVQILLDHIADDRFPSNNMMNIIESLLRPEEMDEYFEALFEKVEAVRYPSVEMMARIQKLVSYLPRAEQNGDGARGRAES
jgi:hypothetical protein